MKTFKHGTTNGYNYHKCHCELCSYASHQYASAYRKTLVGKKTHKKAMIKFLSTEKGKLTHSKANMAYYYTPLGKFRHEARVTVNHAITNGDLVPQPCVCGTTKHIEAHHENYALPLSVEWFCREHHQQLHNWRD